MSKGPRLQMDEEAVRDLAAQLMVPISAYLRRRLDRDGPRQESNFEILQALAFAASGLLATAWDKEALMAWFENAITEAAVDVRNSFSGDSIG
jgi:hypothetical protein